jgi:hypothetical protein
MTKKWLSSPSLFYMVGFDCQMLLFKILVIVVVFSLDPRGSQLITNQNNEVEQYNKHYDESNDG